MQRAAVDMDTVAEAALGGPTYTADEAHFVEALRAGDELAFVALLDRYQPGMLRLARVSVRDVSVAEEWCRKRGLPSCEGSTASKPALRSSGGFRAFWSTARRRGQRASDAASPSQRSGVLAWTHLTWRHWLVCTPLP